MMLKEFIRKRRAKKVAALSVLIDSTTARIEWLDKTMMSSEPLRRKRVRLYWKRNDLYTKLKES